MIRRVFLEIRYIKEFIVLYQFSNYGKAAEELYISESSLYKHIKSLENEIGAPLFIKNGRSIEPTEFGHKFFPYARQLSDIETACMQSFYSYLRTSYNTISIGSEYKILDMTLGFRQKNQKYYLNIIDGNSPGDVKKLMQSGKCELGFFSNFEGPNEDYVVIPYKTDYICAVFPNGHPLASKQPLALSDIAHEDFVMPSLSSTHTSICLSVCEQNKVTPRIVFTVAQPADVINMVRRKMGISLLFEKCVMPVEAEGVTITRITPDIPVLVSLCYPKDARLSAGARLFVDYVKSFL